MADKEKVIKGLECCQKKLCLYVATLKECPYLELRGEYEDAFEDCTSALAKDALALLKAQEPRVTCSVCKHSRCLSEEWFCFKIDSNRYGKRVADGDWYCKDAERR